jgi:hypothetical protein
MVAGDVSGFGQPTVDRPERVGVDAEGGAQLADRRKAGSGKEPAGIDLVGQLPVDLGRDRDVGIASDIQVATGGRIAGRLWDLDFSG